MPTRVAPLPRSDSFSSPKIKLGAWEVTEKTAKERSTSVPNIPLCDEVSKEEKADFARFQARYTELVETRPVLERKNSAPARLPGFVAAKAPLVVREMSTQTIPQSEVKKIYEDMAADGLTIAHVDDYRDPVELTLMQKAGSKSEDLMAKIVELVPPEQLYAAHEVGGDYELTEGSALGINIGVEMLKPDCEQIREYPLRLRSTKALEKACKNSKRPKAIRWVRRHALVDFSVGKNFDIPGAGIGSIVAGGTVDGLAKLEWLSPKIMSYSELERDFKGSEAFAPPMKAHYAKRMRAGAEFSCTRKGKIHGHLQASLVAGHSLAGFATAGVGMSGAVSTDLEREICIHVIAKDGGNKFRVVFRDKDREAAAFNAKIQVGLIASDGLVNKFVPFAESAILKIAEARGHHTGEALLSEFTTLTGYAKTEVHHQDTEIFSVDIELGTPENDNAFDKLWLFSTAEVERLSKIDGSGVRLTTVDEKEIGGSAEVGATLFGVKLAMANTIRNQRRGLVVRENGDKIRYRDKAIEKNTYDFIHGPRHMKWQSLMFKDESKEGEARWKPAYHFYLKEEDYTPSDDEVSSFFRFVEANNIQSVDAEEDRTIDLVTGCHATLTHANKIVTTIDMYFTDAGIRKIDAATKAEARMAYLKAAAGLNPAFKNSPLLSANMEKRLEAEAIVKDFIRMGGKKCCGSSAHEATIAEFEDGYKFTVEDGDDKGRDLEVDAQVYMAAKNFGEVVGTLEDMDNPRQVSRFFTELSKKDEFDYQHAITTLANLAGEEETLVHHVSLQGAGVHFESTDEGAIKDPRERVETILKAIDKEEEGKGEEF